MVTVETLAARIAKLESGPRSINEDFQLEAYRMLLPHLVTGKESCNHNLIESTYPDDDKGVWVTDLVCTKCNLIIEN